MDHAQAFNERLGLLITRTVGTMWCAYAFAVVALISLPSALASGVAGTVQWIAQTFLQLVLLSIILVGQGILGKASSLQTSETHDAVMEEIGLIRTDHVAIADMVTELHAIHTTGHPADATTPAA